MNKTERQTAKTKTESESVATKGIDRRGFLAASGGAAATFAVATQMAGNAYAHKQTGLGQRSDLNFLMQRATRGFNRNEMDVLVTYSVRPDIYRDYLLDVAPTLPDPDADAFIAGILQYLNSSPCQWWAGNCSGPNLGPDNLALGSLSGAMIGRSVTTRSLLYDRCVEFLRQHLNVWIYKDGAPGPMCEDDRLVIRAHALGHFPDMLRASAKSAAMLLYLNNLTNGLPNGMGVPQINENYPREIMELHTLLSRDPMNPNAPPNYTEADVQEAAKILSGWRFRIPGFFPADLNSPYGEFFFDQTHHVNGPKTVLGHTFDDAANPINEGEEFLQLLTEPAFRGLANPYARMTGCNLGFNLAKWFLTYEPTQAVVSSAEAVYRNTRGDIREMVRYLLSPPNLRAFNKPGTEKLRTPYEMVCALFRATEATLANNQYTIVERLTELGQAPYGWAAPNGYPDEAEAWTNLYSRWVFCHEFFARPNGGQGINGVELTDDKLATMLGFTSMAQLQLSGLAQGVEDMLVGAGVLSPIDREVIVAFASLLDPPPVGVTKADVVRETCALAAMLPSFQYF